MTRILPFPMASGGVVILWLLLNQSLSLGHIFLGIAVGLVGGWSLAALQVPNVRIRRLGVIGRLLTLVVTDIVRSNIAVGRIILGLQKRPRTSGFVEIPIDLRNPYGLSALACIITATPGTVWADFDAASGILTIHVLDLIDKAEWIRTIKTRYERHLLAIFE
jgi:multicomponent K+:H+ antiporter subunit E